MVGVCQLVFPVYQQKMSTAHSFSLKTNPAVYTRSPRNARAVVSCHRHAAFLVTDASRAAR